MLVRTPIGTIARLLSLTDGATSLSDTGITYDQIETAAVGYCYGDSTSGQVCIAKMLNKL